MKQIKVKIGNLFKAIEELEDIKLKKNKEYKQNSQIKIQNENNDWYNVPAIIKKEDDLIKLSFSDGSSLICGYLHKLIRDKKNLFEVYAKDVLIGDEFETSDSNKIYVENIQKLYKKDVVYDLQIDSKNHLYITPNKLIHHNTLISALLTRAYKGKTLMIFDRIELVHQTYEAFINELGFDESEIGLIQGNNYKYSRDNKVILLSMMSYEKAMHVFPQVDVIQTDECHVTGRTETAQKIIYSCQNASIKIGLSATPDRIDNPAEQLRLYSILGPVIYHKKIKEQQDDGYIADTKVEIYNVEYPNGDMLEVTGSYNDKYERTNITRQMIIDQMRENAKEKEEKLTVKSAREMVSKYYDDDKKVEEVDEAIERIIENFLEENPLNKYTKEEGIYILQEFVKLGDESTHYILNDMRNDLIAELALKNKRVLILFNKIVHGEELLKRIGDRARLIHGSHSREERDEAQKYLEENEDAIVIASKIWGTGKNIPILQTYINAGGGVSEIEQIQKMGRVVRLHEDKGKAKIIDFLDNFSRLAKKQSNKRLRTYQKENLDIKYF